VRVPEAAMDKYCLSAAREPDVGSSWNTLKLKAKPVSEPMQQAPHYELGPCVGPFYPGHVRTALPRRKSVCQLVLRLSGNEPVHPKSTAFFVRLSLP